ncbi:D-lactate dehydrogenase [Rhexocercosporidium sp. MPI-PUGE-AT-0058]|nr:D-lactate dehydrogenase [Rhexocercosporidium sp. MPI-PUGE-AT-0058]
MANTKLTSLESFLEEHPHITYATPSSSNYISLRQIFARDQEATPLAIVRPQSAADVSLLVKFAVSNSIKFTIRTGGHNLSGAAIAQDALAIDMRDIAYVNILADKKSAKIGGGVLVFDVATALEKEGLATPVGAVGSVGYVGWATYGGYGPLSRQFGLGVDQIVGAKIVKSDGEVIVADERLLKGLRGGGGLFGVIVELEIKVYPLKNVLTGTMVLDSQDLASTFKRFNTGYLQLSAKGMPSQLVLQQMIFNSPQGKVMCVAFMWSSEDVETGRTWLGKIEALATVVMNTVAVSTVADYLQGNAALVPESVHGAGFTHNFREITSEVAEIISGNLLKMAEDPGCMFVVHELKGASSTANNSSVFGTRDEHFMLEIIGYALDIKNRESAMAWAENTWAELAKTESSNLLPGKYISLDRPVLEPGTAPLSRLYGLNCREVLALKEEYDSEDVFSHAVPQLKNYV